MDSSPHPGVECGLGRMYEKRGRPEAQNPDIEKAIKRYSNVVEYGELEQGYVRYAHYGLGCVYERLGCKAARGGDGEGTDSGDSANVCYNKAEGHYRKAAGLPGDDKRRRDADPKRNAAHNKSLASWVDSKVREEDDKRLRDAHDKAMKALRSMYERGLGGRKKGGFDVLEMEMMARAAEQGDETAMDWLDENWSKLKTGQGGNDGDH